MNDNNKRKLPKEFKAHDNRDPEVLISYFLREFTKRGDKVLDPFAGLGTTLFVSEAMGRIPFGIEIDKRRAEYIKSQIKNKSNVVNGDSKDILTYRLPKMDFCITSPSYLSKDKKGYTAYLKKLYRIFNKLRKLMRPNAYLVITCVNIKGKRVTTFAWDIAREVSKSFVFQGEVVIGWKPAKYQKSGANYGGTYGYGYDHSYALIFKNKV